MTTRKDIQALRDEAEQSASLGNFEEAARLFDLALSAAGDGEIDDDRDLLIGLLLSSATAYGVARGSTESVGQLVEQRCRRALEIIGLQSTHNNAREAEVRHRLAMTIYEGGRQEEALVEWLEAAQLARSAPDNLRQRSWVLRGLVPLVLDLRRFEEALPLAEEAIWLNEQIETNANQRTFDRIFRASALIGLGRKADAAAVLHETIEERRRLGKANDRLLTEAERLLTLALEA